MMFDLDNVEIDDWGEIEHSVASLCPNKIPLENLVKADIEEALFHFCNRRDAEKNSLPKSASLKVSDLLSKRAHQMAQAMERVCFTGTTYEIMSKDGSPTGENVSAEHVIRIMESIYWHETYYAKHLEKWDTFDPVPGRKRLGIALFLLGERAFGLSSKRTTPPDRGASEPSGHLFAFVAAVLAQVGESVTPTTLEQWSRDAQLRKRELEAEKLAGDIQRRAARAWIAQHGDPLPAPDAPGSHLRNAPHRDWLIADDD